MPTSFQKKMVFLSLSLMTLGCSSGMSDMPEDKLRTMYWECQGFTNPSPGKAISCENARKECERRKKDKGYSVC